MLQGYDREHVLRELWIDVFNNPGRGIATAHRTPVHCLAYLIAGAQRDGPFLQAVQLIQRAVHLRHNKIRQVARGMGK